MGLFFFSSRRRHTRFDCDWSSDVCSSDLKSDIRLFLHFLVTLIKYLDLKLWKAVRFLTFYKRWTVRKLIWKRGQLFRPAVHLGVALLRSEERRVGKESRFRWSTYT